MKQEHYCEGCRETTKWHISTGAVSFGGKLPEVIAVCSECYDGAPDAGYRVGQDDTVEDAVVDYNRENYSCKRCGYLPSEQRLWEEGDPLCIPCRQADEADAYEYWCGQKYDEMKDEGKF